MELMFTMRPKPYWRMEGRALRVTRSTPKKFVSKSCCASARLVSSNAPASEYPALLTSQSIWPACCKTDCTPDATLESSVTSICNSSTPSKARAAPGSRTVPNTRAPRLASSCAVSRPMPEETPVIKATLFSDFILDLQLCRVIGLRTEWVGSKTPGRWGVACVGIRKKLIYMLLMSTYTKTDCIRVEPTRFGRQPPWRLVWMSSRRSSRGSPEQPHLR
jgi:hypothetical protein